MAKDEKTTSWGDWRSGGPTNPGEMCKSGPTKGEPKLSGVSEKMMPAPRDAKSGK